jgi:hypothetical protein
VLPDAPLNEFIFTYISRTHLRLHDIILRAFFGVGLCPQHSHRGLARD